MKKLVLMLVWACFVAPLLAQDSTLQEVVISGLSIHEKAQATIKIDVVKTKDIFTNGYLSLAQALANNPGVSLISTGPGIERPVIRGLSGNRILSVQNGVKLENQQWDPEHALGLTQYGVKQVEIIKGPASFLYGSDALGGVLHFVDEAPALQNTLAAEAFTGFNSNTFGINSGIGVKAAKKNMYWGLNLGLNNQSDYYDANFERVANSRFREFVAKANFGIKHKNSITHFDYQLHMGYYGIIEPFEAKDTTGKEEEDHPMEFETPYHTLLHQTFIAKNTYTKNKNKFTTTFSYQNDIRKELEKDDTEANPFLGFNLNVATLDAKLEHTLSPKKSLIAGVQGNIQGNKNFGYSVLIPNYLQTDFSVYGLSRNNYFNNKLRLDLGFRYDMRQVKSKLYGIKDSADYMQALSKSFSNTSFSGAFNYQLMKQFFIYFNFGSGYRAPNLAELSSNGIRLETQRYEIGSSNMKKEVSVQQEVGVHSTHKYFAYSASYFMHQISNYIYTTKRGDTLLSYPVYEFKQNDAVLDGGEVSVQLYPATKKWFLFTTAFSTVRARFSNKEYVPLMPANKLNSELVLKKDVFKAISNSYLRFQFTQVFAQNNTATLELKTPAYQLVNLGFGGDVLVYGYKLQISAGVNNVLNQKYYDHLSRLRPYGVYNMGLNAFINIKVPLQMSYN